MSRFYAQELSSLINKYEVSLVMILKYVRRIVYVELDILRPHIKSVA